MKISDWISFSIRSQDQGLSREAAFNDAVNGIVAELMAPADSLVATWTGR